MDDQIIGLIVFALIAVFSGLAKLQERRKEEQARDQRAASRPRVEDLPEATRRMLYGDTTPPVARRRSEGVPTPPPMAQPRPVQQQGIPVAPQRRPVPQRQQNMPPAPQQRQMPPQRPYAPEAPRPIAQPMQQRDWREVPQRQEAARPLPDPRRDTVAAAERERERQRAVAEAAREEAAIRNEKAPASPATKSTRPSQAQLFRSLAKNKNALRASMITMEVIGTPKGLRS